MSWLSNDPRVAVSANRNTALSPSRLDEAKVHVISLSPMINKHSGGFDNLIIHELIAHKLGINIERNFSVYVMTSCNRMLLDRLYSAGSYAKVLSDINCLPVNEDGSPPRVTMDFSGFSIRLDAQYWSKGYARCPTAFLRKVDPLPRQINIMVQRIEWVLDNILEIASERLHDPDPNFRISEI